MIVMICQYFLSWRGFFHRLSGGGEAAELAFAALVERHGPMVLRVCRGVLADPHTTRMLFRPRSSFW